MKRSSATISLTLMFAGLLAADPENADQTNFSTNSRLASDNLTVKAPGAPWGGSKRTFVPAKPPPSREAVEAMAQLHRRAEERRERERLEQLLKEPTLFDEYYVHLSPASDHSTNSPAK